MHDFKPKGSFVKSFTVTKPFSDGGTRKALVKARNKTKPLFQIRSAYGKDEYVLNHGNMP